MKKIIRLAFYTDKKTRDEINQAAKDDSRSVSSWIELAIREKLKSVAKL